MRVNADRPHTRDITLYVNTVLAVSVLFMVGVGVPCGIAFGAPAGWGLGGMCAFWGGPGFGVMAAGALRELRNDRRYVTDPAQPVPERHPALAAAAC